MLRAIRGATTAPSNGAEEILDAVQELLGHMLAANELGADHLVCAFFSATPDLDAAFPAAAARRIGWTDVPLFGAQEMAVPGAPRRCLRVMLLADRPEGAPAARHIYLREARELRPDLTAGGDSFSEPPVLDTVRSGLYYPNRY